MRPPLNAGENEGLASALAAKRPSFNEAPAERGGKLPRGVCSEGKMYKLQ